MCKQYLVSYYIIFRYIYLQFCPFFRFVLLSQICKINFVLFVTCMFNLTFFRYLHVQFCPFLLIVCLLLHIFRYLQCQLGQLNLPYKKRKDELETSLMIYISVPIIYLH
jgi:hypothetical protein